METTKLETTVTFEYERLGNRAWIAEIRQDDWLVGRAIFNSPADAWEWIYKQERKAIECNNAYIFEMEHKTLGK